MKQPTQSKYGPGSEAHKAFQRVTGCKDVETYLAQPKTTKRGYMIFNYTDNIFASPDVFMARKEARAFIVEFRQRYVKQGYYRNNRLEKIEPRHIDLEVIPQDFNPFKH